VSANAIEITYSYSDTQKVVRFEWPDATNPKGHDKTYRQFHLNPNGEKVWNKGRTPWPAYRIDEVLGILENTPVNEPVVPLMLEGELNVELGRRTVSVALRCKGQTGVTNKSRR
jgi:putative DNA primase/helicase